MKRVAFRTVGCRLNQAETAHMAARFEARGYTVVPFGHPADLVVIHSCAITQRAERDSLRASRLAKRMRPPPQVIIAGCAVAIAPERIRRESRADRIVGQADKFRLPDLLDRPAASRAPAVPEHLPPPRFETTRAFIKVQDGCDFCCAYCVVPRARGAPVSRPMAEILSEAKQLSERGFQEIVLTGANLGLYAEGQHRLPELLERLEAIPGIRRIRLSSIEISTAERAIVDYIAGSDKCCRSLHLPLQSGDDTLLRAMGRRYDSRTYRAAVDYALSRIPRLGLGTDILVGFPGETPSAFHNTVSLVRDIPFAYLHVFPYSARPGTRAATLSHSLSDSERSRRCRHMMELAQEKREAFARRFIGLFVSVLIERVRGTGGATGWTSEYCGAEVFGRNLHPNQIVSFRPHAAHNGRLVGTVDDAGTASV